MTIIVNAIPHEIDVVGNTLTYEEIVIIAGMKGTPSMVYHWRKPGTDIKREGILSPGKSVTLEDKMIFDVAHTNNA